MAKPHSLFVCQQCGYESPRWLGKCPSCDSWNSFVETVISNSTAGAKSQSPSIKSVSLSSIANQKMTRISTKIDEFDQILGGGIVTGQAILIAGLPGIGKSTLLLQIADNLSDVLYVSGEESVNQIAIRAKRLKIKNNKIEIIESTDIDSILSSAEKLKPKILIIDSIQTMQTQDLSGMAGSVGQVRECAFRLVRFAKSNNIPVFIVGHVTKEGSVAGPAVLAHIVDTVLWFEGDKNLTFRMIRSLKNRFGPTDEVGVFEMKELGLVSVANPEKIFLPDDVGNVAGRSIGAIMQGSRPVLVEVESLVVPTKLAFPKRIAQGVDSKRFELLLAVLTRRGKLPLYDNDCFVNIAGGVIARSPSVDLSVCLAVASAYFDKPIASDVLAVGEVGLLGEIREVVAEDKIIKLGKRLGYKTIISSKEYKSLPLLIHKIFKI